MIPIHVTVFLASRVCIVLCRLFIQEHYIEQGTHYCSIINPLAAKSDIRVPLILDQPSVTTLNQLHPHPTLSVYILNHLIISSCHFLDSPSMFYRFANLTFASHHNLLHRIILNIRRLVLIAEVLVVYYPSYTATPS